MSTKPRRTRSAAWRCRKPHAPFIAACRDPLALWALHWFDARIGSCWFRYYADRAAARTALRAFKADPAAFESAIAKGA